MGNPKITGAREAQKIRETGKFFKIQLKTNLFNKLHVVMQK